MLVANINLLMAEAAMELLADKQAGGPRQLGVPQCFFPLPSCAGVLYGISQGQVQRYPANPSMPT